MFRLFEIKDDPYSLKNNDFDSSELKAIDTLKIKLDELDNNFIQDYYPYQLKLHNVFISERSYPNQSINNDVIEELIQTIDVYLFNKVNLFLNLTLNLREQ